MIRNSFLFSIFLVFWLSSFCIADDKCYNLDLIKITEDLQLYQNCRQSVELYKEAISELETQNKLLKEQNDLLKEQLKIYSIIGDNYKEVIEIQKQIIKASKPSILQRLSDISVGIAIGAILILLL